MKNLPESFGVMVFGDNVMKARLPRETYKAMRRTIEKGKKLDINIAHIVANAMKDWAIEKGATHYTHWFQPMTEFTAEKHDSFISPTSNGEVIMEFSGKELIKGEPDASSFPSGGLRATFEARGYTTWDPTSYAFIKDDTLYIPTAFCSYGGEALDMKTPLLRSMETLNKQALRILKLFGNENIKIVQPTVGAEQEYFLIDKEACAKRKDLLYTGRTLFGAKSPKGQELADHYFGAIKPRVAAFMADIDKKLWEMGVYAKTEHNEVAPAQHELAPVFTTANIAADHNQLIMETMKRTADEHGLACLFHEKPFEGVNGSGKHNNWSLITNTGINLLEPGDSPYEDAQFLLFLCATIAAVDDYQDLMRISVASASNDIRLGAHEAPPVIVSISLGEDLSKIIDALEKGKLYVSQEEKPLKVGVHILPDFSKDTADRNRTSPFAFTGNKFEFRMPGSNMSIAGPTFILNTAVAETLSQFADILEKADDFQQALHGLIKSSIKKHKRIIFNGNGYDQAWIKEAQKRGLLYLPTTPDCAPYLLLEKNISLFKKHKVLTEKEIYARYEIMLNNYCNAIEIEALTMINMLHKEILPAVFHYGKELGEGIVAVNQTGISKAITQKEILKIMSELTDKLYERMMTLENDMKEKNNITEAQELALYYKDIILKDMDKVRQIVDRLEMHIAEVEWPFPAYGKLFFSAE